MTRNRFYIISLVVIFLIMSVLSRTTRAQSQRDEAIQYLNLHVDYINETIHSINIFRNHLRIFNRSLLTYDHTGYNFDRGHYFQKHETMRETLHKSWYYRPTPPEIRAQLQKFSPLEYALEQEILEGMTALRKNLEEMEVISDSIQHYLEKELYRQDDSLRHAYQWLEQCASAIHHYDEIKENYYQSIREVYEKFYLKDIPATPLSRTALLWEDWMQIAKEMFEKVRYQPAKDIRQDTTQLRSRLDALRANQESHLAGAPDFGSNNGKDPDVQYKFCLGDAEAILSHARDYLKNDPERYRWKKHNKSYIFYNDKFLNKYNRYGVGLVQGFNKMISVNATPLLKWVEEPHWFEVLYPESKQTPQKQALATDSLPDLEGALPNHLVFLLDVSASMNQPEKLPLLKEAFLFLLTRMRPQDSITLVTYSGEAQAPLIAMSAQNKQEIAKKIESLRSGGGTEAQTGIQLAYELAEDHLIPQGNNRIILATDGAFELKSRYQKMIEKYAQKQIYLSVFYLGKAEAPTYRKQLQTLSRKGQGNYRYIQPENSKQHLIEEARQFAQE